MLLPGAVEVEDGLITWVGDPWQVPGGRRDRGAPARWPAHARPRELPRPLADDPGAQRRGRAAARPVAERERLAARGAADGRGRVLGHGARRGRAARQRRHDHLRAVPPSRPGHRGRDRLGHPCHVHAGDLRRPRRRPGNGWEDLLEEACRLFDAMEGREGRLHLGFGPHAVYTVPPEGLRDHRRGGAAARRAACRSICPRRWPRASEVRERYGMSAPALLESEGALDGPRAGGPLGVARRRRPGDRRPTRRGGGPLPGLQREAGRGHRAAAARCWTAACGWASAPTGPPPTTTCICGTRCGWPPCWPAPPPPIPARSTSAEALRLATRGGGEALGPPGGLARGGPAGGPDPPAHRRCTVHALGDRRRAPGPPRLGRGGVPGDRRLGRRGRVSSRGAGAPRSTGSGPGPRSAQRARRLLGS